VIFVEERLDAAVPVDRHELLLRLRANIDDEVGQRGGILRADSPASAQARSGMRTLVSGVFDAHRFGGHAALRIGSGVHVGPFSLVY
jgi:hypothetical protein